MIGNYNVNLLVPVLSDSRCTLLLIISPYSAPTSGRCMTMKSSVHQVGTLYYPKRIHPGTASMNNSLKLNNLPVILPIMLHCGKMYLSSIISGEI